MVDQVFPPIGKDGFDPDFRIQVLKQMRYFFRCASISCSGYECGVTLFCEIFVAGFKHLKSLKPSDKKTKRQKDTQTYNLTALQP